MLTLAGVLILGAMGPLLASTVVTVAIPTLGHALAALTYGLVQVGAHGYALLPLTLGVGPSAANMAVMVGAYRDLRPEQVPHASSTPRITQQLGGAFGTAVLAVILQSQLTGHPAASAFDTTFTWVLAFTTLAAVAAMLLPGSTLRQR